MNSNTAHRLLSARKGKYVGSKRRSVHLSTARDKHPVSRHDILLIRVSEAPAPVQALND